MCGRIKIPTGPDMAYYNRAEGYWLFYPFHLTIATEDLDIPLWILSEPWGHVMASVVPWQLKLFIKVLSKATASNTNESIYVQRWCIKTVSNIWCIGKISLLHRHDFPFSLSYSEQHHYCKGYNIGLKGWCFILSYITTSREEINTVNSIMHSFVNIYLHLTYRH